MVDYGVSAAQVNAAAGILRANGHNVPLATLERAIAAAVDEDGGLRAEVQKHRARKHAPLTADQIDASDELLWAALSRRTVVTRQHHPQREAF